jgi:hypothetical protein
MRGCDVSEVVRIPYTLVREEPTLLDEYKRECANPLLGEPDPDWAMYAHLETVGAFQAFAVYEGPWMIGFAGVVTSRLPHYSKKYGAIESLFVTKAHRHTAAGASLFFEVMRYGKEEGCTALLGSAPAGSELEAQIGRHGRRTHTGYCIPLA